MNIGKWFIRKYLDHPTVCWFNRHKFPPDRVEEYLPLVIEMGKIAALSGEEEQLRIAFDFLLGTTSMDCSEFGNGRWDFDDEEVRDILRFSRNALWPGVPETSSDVLAGVRIVDDSLPVWDLTQSKKKPK